MLCLFPLSAALAKLFCESPESVFGLLTRLSLHRVSVDGTYLQDGNDPCSDGRRGCDFVSLTLANPDLRYIAFDRWALTE